MPTIKVKYGGDLEKAAERAKRLANRTGKPVEIHYQRISTEGETYGQRKFYWAFYGTVPPQRAA